MDHLADRPKMTQDVRKRGSAVAGAAGLLAAAAANNVGYDAARAPIGGAEMSVDLSAEGPTPPGAPRRRPMQGDADKGWMRPAENPSGPSPRAKQMATARATAGQMNRVGHRGSVQAAGAHAEAESASTVLPPLTPGRGTVEGGYDDDDDVDDR
jgi:hypothetical protein